MSQNCHDTYNLSTIELVVTAKNFLTQNNIEKTKIKSPVNRSKETPNEKENDHNSAKHEKTTDQGINDNNFICKHGVQQRSNHMMCI